ncbi:MAG: hypothetical protein QM691_09570 [Opitutaceae bacterium]
MSQLSQKQLRRFAFCGAILFFITARALAQAIDHGSGENLPAKRPEDDPFDLLRFNTVSAEHFYSYDHGIRGVSLVFLPPEAPPLHTPPRLRSPLDSGVQPPAELAEHVTDPFYPQLAATLAADALPRRLRVKLDDYRSARAALLTELHEALAQHRDSPPEVRRSALAETAVAQAHRLQELENVAEQLRAELRATAYFSAGKATEEAATPPRHSTTKAAALRSAAFFCEGLSPAQRRLLQAVAYEQENSPEPLTAGLLCFTPEGASVALPENLDDSARSMIAEFVAARKSLASDIIRMIAEVDANPRRLQQLAAEQAAVLAALEDKAEAIRPLLQPVPDTDGSPQPQLPAELAERLAAYREHKKTLFRELHASILAAPGPYAASTGRPGEVAVSVAAFSAEQQAALGALNAEKASLRTALAEHRRRSGGTTDRRSIDTLLEDFERSRQQQELRELYLDYRRALFEPGLSPAQRRLLFAAAVRALALPLPSGEPLRQP